MYKNKKSPHDGLNFFCRMAGLFGQRLYFFTERLKIILIQIKFNLSV